MRPPKFPWLRMVIYLPVTAACCAGAIACAVMALYVPPLLVLTIPLFMVGCWPPAHWMNQYNICSAEYNNRDKPLVEGTPEWELDEEDEAAIIAVMNTKGRGRNA